MLTPVYVRNWHSCNASANFDAMIALGGMSHRPPWPSCTARATCFSRRTPQMSERLAGAGAKAPVGRSVARFFRHLATPPPRKTEPRCECRGEQVPNHVVPQPRFRAPCSAAMVPCRASRMSEKLAAAGAYAPFDRRVAHYVRHLGTPPPRKPEPGGRHPKHHHASTTTRTTPEAEPRKPEPRRKWRGELGWRDGDV